MIVFMLLNEWFFTIIACLELCCGLILNLFWRRKVAELPIQNLFRTVYMVHAPAFQEHLLVVSSFILLGENQSRWGRKGGGCLFETGRKIVSFSNQFVGFLLIHIILFTERPVSSFISNFLLSSHFPTSVVLSCAGFQLVYLHIHIQAEYNF